MDKEPVKIDPETVELIKWFRENKSKLPKQPFRLNVWMTIVDPKKFYSQLEADTDQYPHGLRRNGIKEVLKSIKDYTPTC